MSEQNQDQNKGKIQAQYEGAMSKLKAILKNEKVALPTQVERDEIDEIVKELYAEEHEKLRTEVKSELTILLKKHLDLKREIIAKEKELSKLKETKQKEFVEACSKLFGKIENIGDLVKEYSESLKEGIKGSSQSQS